MVTAANGQSTVNGLTFHVIKTTGASAERYNPHHPRGRPRQALRPG